MLSERLKMQITHVAIKTDKVYSLPKPNRHNHVMKMMVDHFNQPKPVKGVQGFLVDGETFVNRQDAFKIVITNGQLNYPFETAGDEELFSEDVW